MKFVHLMAVFMLGMLLVSPVASAGIGDWFRDVRSSPSEDFKGINVDFGFTGGAISSQRGAAAVDNGYYWNSVYQRSNDYSAVLKFSDRADSDVNVNVNNLEGGWGGNYGVNSPMYNTYIYNWGESAGVSFSGLSPGIYDVYIYGHGDADGQVGMYELAVGESDNYGLKQTSSDNSARSGITWNEDSQYVKYNDVEVLSGEDLTVRIDSVAYGSMLNGIQIVPVGSSVIDNPHVTGCDDGNCIVYEGDKVSYEGMEISINYMSDSEVSLDINYGSESEVTNVLNENSKLAFTKAPYDKLVLEILEIKKLPVVTEVGSVKFEIIRSDGKKSLVCGNLGDVNSDGRIGEDDLQIIGDIAVGNDVGSAEATKDRGDVNGDGVVDVADVIVTGNYLAGSIATFPGCEVGSSGKSLFEFFTSKGGSTVGVQVPIVDGIANFNIAYGEDGLKFIAPGEARDKRLATGYISSSGLLTFYDKREYENYHGYIVMSNVDAKESYLLDFEVNEDTSAGRNEVSVRNLAYTGNYHETTDRIVGDVINVGSVSFEIKEIGKNSKDAWVVIEAAERIVFDIVYDTNGNHLEIPNEAEFPYEHFSLSVIDPDADEEIYPWGEIVEVKLKWVNGKIDAVECDGRCVNRDYVSKYHSADLNENWKISQTELDRVIELYEYTESNVRSGSYHCDASTHDGYEAGIGDRGCKYHSADTNNDWEIDLSENLRVVSLMNLGGYSPYSNGEDGYAPINHVFDVDGDGVVSDDTDGLLITRRLFEFNNIDQFKDAVGSGATRSEEEILEYIDGLTDKCVLDLDGNGKQDALTDGIMIQRYVDYAQYGDIFIKQTIASDATRTTETEVLDYLAEVRDGVNYCGENPSSSGSSSGSCSTGCYASGQCYPVGHRTAEGLYCIGQGIFVSQSAEDAICLNNYECGSNVCIDGTCIEGSLFLNFLEWFKDKFG
jgi:hypothetical protein